MKTELIKWVISSQLPSIKKLYLLEQLGVKIKDESFIESVDQINKVYVFELSLTIPKEEGGELDAIIK